MPTATPAQLREAAIKQPDQMQEIANLYAEGVDPASNVAGELPAMTFNAGTGLPIPETLAQFRAACITSPNAAVTAWAAAG